MGRHNHQGIYITIRPTYDNDIALVKIHSDDGEGIRFNDYVQPACLPTMDTSYRPGTLCHISGWGKTEHGGNLLF
jgi:hypothetical protein